MLFRNKQQTEISEQRRMPVDGVGSDALTPVASETVQLYYFNAGVYTIDAGQAAGTVVVGKLANRNILGAAGDVVGTYGDTSLSFTSTAFLTLKQFDQIAAEMVERDSANNLLQLAAKAAAVTDGFVNGEYCVDHRTGMVYGVKDDNSVTLTSTAYNVNIAVSGGGGGIASDVNIAKVGGTAVTLGQKASAASIPVVLANDDLVEIQGDVADDAVDSGNPVGIGGLAVAAQRAAVGALDRVKAVFTIYGEMIVAGYSYTNQNLRTGETDPISTHHLEATLADVTNGADGTYNYYVDMDGHSNLGLQLVLSGGSGTVTVKVYGSIQDDGTAQSSCVYYDVTTDAYGLASYTATDMLNDSAGFFGQFKYVKIEVVASTGAADDADWTIYSKKKY